MGIFKILRESLKANSVKSSKKGIEQEILNLDYNNAGIAEEKVKNSIRVNRIKDRIKLFGLKDEIFHDYIIAVYTLSLSISWCDKEFHHSEEKEINSFIEEISSSRLPKEIKAKIKEISEFFDNLEDKSQLNLLNIAIEEIRKYTKKHKITVSDLNDFDDIIIMIINSDGHLRHSEKSFFSMWFKKKEEIYKEIS